MGHEFCGMIRSVNEESAWKVGQRVMVDPRLLCSSCDACRSGRDNQCPIIGSLGVTGIGGGFGEVVLVNERMLHPIPNDVRLEHAVLAEPLSVAHHAVKRAGVEVWAEKSVLVVGGGPVGYAVVLCLKAKGVKNIVVSEPTETRRSQIGLLVDCIVDPVKEAVGDKCRAMTDDRGIDVAFDCAGVQQGLEAALEVLGCNGVWVNVSIWGGPMIPPFGPFLMKEITLRTSMVYSCEDFREVMECINQGELLYPGFHMMLTILTGRYPGLERMVTGKISLDDLVSKGLKQLAESREGHIKILVTPKQAQFIDRLSR